LKIKTASCEVLKHLTNLPEIKNDWSNGRKLQTIEKVYKELSDLVLGIQYLQSK